MPLHAVLLRPEAEAPYSPLAAEQAAGRLTLAAMGGSPFLLLVFSYHPLARPGLCPGPARGQAPLHRREALRAA